MVVCTAKPKTHQLCKWRMKTTWQWSQDISILQKLQSQVHNMNSALQKKQEVLSLKSPLLSLLFS